jgi:hypothetical protein
MVTILNHHAWLSNRVIEDEFISKYVGSSYILRRLSILIHSLSCLKVEDLYFYKSSITLVRFGVGTY